NYN
ncbi:transposase, partial [Vibrio cholerae O1 str. NHCC-006C]